MEVPGSDRPGAGAPPRIPCPDRAARSYGIVRTATIDWLHSVGERGSVATPDRQRPIKHRSNRRMPLPVLETSGIEVAAAVVIVVVGSRDESSSTGRFSACVK